MSAPRRLLLDTNAALWVLMDSPRLGQGSRLLIQAAEIACYSAVSVVEISIKTMLGKLAPLPDFAEACERAGLRELPLDAEASARLTDFPQLARHDPFDRMLLAQSASIGLTLLTSDATLLGLGLVGVRDART